MIGYGRKALTTDDVRQLLGLDRLFRDTDRPMPPGVYPIDVKKPRWFWRLRAKCRQAIFGRS